MSWLKDEGLNRLAKVKKEVNSEVGIRNLAWDSIFSIRISVSDQMSQFSQDSPG